MLLEVVEVRSCYHDNYHVTSIIIIVEARVERQEHIVMGTSGTMLDWVIKKKVCTQSYHPPSLLPHHLCVCVCVCC